MDENDGVPEIETPLFTRLTPESDRGWMRRQLKRIALIVSLSTVAGSALGGAWAVARWLGASTTSPAAAVRRVELRTDSNAKAIGRLIEITEAGARYTCSKDLAGAQQSGYPCRPLLEGRGILTPQSGAPADGSFTSAVLSAGLPR
jgi:hypothetical protein